MFELTFIGLDVHAVTVVGHALNPATGEISAHSMAADITAGQRVGRQRNRDP